MRLLFFLLFLGSFGSIAQISLRDSSRNVFLAGVNYKATLPGGDLSQRWGFHNSIGGDIDQKFKSNLTVGLSGSFIFGSQLRDSTIFSDLYNSFGTITSMSGAPGDILFLMRGFTSYATAGYVFNRLGNNANSGLWVKAGLGFMMHKIRIESLYDAVPQLEGDYRKGYDKLTTGFSSMQFIGYLYQANVRLLKFYAGFEFTQGFTQNVRNYNFDTGGPENDSRIDLQYGFKVGWILPISHRTKSEYYYD